MSAADLFKIRCAACRELFAATDLVYNSTRQDLLCKACDAKHQPEHRRDA